MPLSRGHIFSHGLFGALISTAQGCRWVRNMCGCGRVHVCVCVWGAEWCFGLVTLLRLQTKAIRILTERHTADCLQNRLFLPPSSFCDFILFPQIYSCPVLSGFGSSLSFFFPWLFAPFFSSGLCYSVYVCHQTLALTRLTPPGSEHCGEALEDVRLSFSPGVSVLSLFILHSLLFYLVLIYIFLTGSFCYYSNPSFSVLSYLFMSLSFFPCLAPLFPSCVGHFPPPLSHAAPFLNILLCPTFLSLSSLISVSFFFFISSVLLNFLDNIVGYTEQFYFCWTYILMYIESFPRKGYQFFVFFLLPGCLADSAEPCYLRFMGAGKPHSLNFTSRSD